MATILCFWAGYLIYDEFVLEREQEWKWCMTTFLEKHKLLVPNFLIKTMSIDPVRAEESSQKLHQMKDNNIFKVSL